MNAYDQPVISRLRFGRGAIAVIVALATSLLTVGGVAFAGTTSHPVVVAIGDSIMAGHGLSAGQSWVGTLAKQDGWKFTNLASDGSGFVRVGDAGDTFASQARVAIALHPSVVLIAGSSNDLGESNVDLAAATTATLKELRSALPSARIIAVSAVWGATSLPAQLVQINSQVQAAMAAVGGEYVDIHQPLAGHPELMQSDGIHPTAVGQHALADSVVDALRESLASP